MKTVSEIAKEYGVTRTTVYTWLNDGLPYKREKIIGIKTRIIIDPVDVTIFHRGKVGKREDK